jgi:GT2 family glycosyltransferase
VAPEQRAQIVNNATAEPMKISVIVATCNRSNDVVRLLEALQSQLVPPDVQWEALIVDNNSTDDTQPRAMCFVERDSSRFKYLQEKRQGKSRALNTGAREAKGEVLVYTDDDCVPDRNWLGNIARKFSADPLLAVVGGRVELFDISHKPFSIRPYLENKLISGTDDLFKYMIGANMAIRRPAVDAVGGFDPFLGPGTRVIFEDLDILYRLLKMQVKMAYCPDVVIYHNHGRTRDDQVEALNHGYVIGRGAFYCKHILRRDSRVMRLAYWEIKNLFANMIRETLRGRSGQEQWKILWGLMVGAGRRLS